MLRAVLSKAVSVTRSAQKTQVLKCLSGQRCLRVAYCTNQVQEVSSAQESEEEILMNLGKTDKINGWDIRQVVNYLQLCDYIPSAPAIEALMHACRQVNDYAMAVRILEAVKAKCGKDQHIYVSLMESIKPTLDKLGILTPEQMGYDKPELYLKDPFDIHN